MEKRPKNMQEMLKALLIQHQQNEKWSTASLYSSVLKCLNRFTNEQALPYSGITKEWLKAFESSLRASGCKWNTVSTYLRIIRTALNRAIEYGDANYQPYLFNKVYMGVKADKCNVLDPCEMRELIRISMEGSDLLTPTELMMLQRFVLLFYLRGMPFVDFAFIKKTELKDMLLTYRRRKTGSYIVVEIEKPAARLLHKLRCMDSDSPYLFPIIHHPDGSEEAFIEYQNAIRCFNKHLSAISSKLGLSQKLSSYTARHTWATMAFYCEISPGIISQALGHSSIKITETYLKPFQLKVIHQANRQVIDYILSKHLL
ncbi:MAG: site-specific integrase [Bacteroidaceae bacterium]|nr:site-specific integrase [Bacteroidaceae bacterium]